MICGLRNCRKYWKAMAMKCNLRKVAAVITIPKHKPIKKVYIKLVKNIVESEEEK